MRVSSGGEVGFEARASWGEIRPGIMRAGLIGFATSNQSERHRYVREEILCIEAQARISARHRGGGNGALGARTWLLC